MSFAVRDWIVHIVSIELARLEVQLWSSEMVDKSKSKVIADQQHHDCHVLSRALGKVRREARRAVTLYHITPANLP